ncbi:MAG TPA: hypothetical protein VNX60_03345 [Candidatus Acidoferrum sp.]|jgi:hypothetical protein|nr:hypothetical protein [Candidatus Acidoferrum sp.]
MIWPFRGSTCVSSSSARTNPPDDFPDELAPCKLPVDEFAGIVDGYDAPRAYDAQVGIGCDFCEHSAKRMA